MESLRYVSLVKLKWGFILGFSTFENSCEITLSFLYDQTGRLRPEAALIWNYILAAALESEQQLIILATKPTKKHEIYFLF